MSGANTHAVVAALAEDDLDRAMETGLLAAMPCFGCVDACNARVIAARDARRSALDARKRYRARQARLARRAEERAAARAAPVTATPEAKPALPSAAAAALARAKARAAERRNP
jgi:Na+-translocating ferredoxin:NAD+ oxidoreductase RnfC subunit